MDACTRRLRRLPRSFPKERYAAMERFIASKVRRERGPQHGIRSGQQSVDPSDLHPADPITGCGSGQHIGGVSGVMESEDTLWIRDNEEGLEIDTGLAPLVRDPVGHAVDSGLDCLRPYEESIPGATYEGDGPVASLSSYLTQLIEPRVTSVIHDSVACKKTSTIDNGALTTELAPLLKQLIAEEVRSAIEPISSTLLAQKHEDRMYQRDIHALAEKKRALALEEEELLKRGLKRQRVATRRPRKESGSAMIIPTFQGLNITRPDADLS